VNPFAQMVAWLNDPLNWTNPDGILVRLQEHLEYSAAAVLIGCIVAWPIGLWLGHVGRGGQLVVLLSNVTLAIPTIALLTILPLTALGFTRWSVIIALAVFALPPLLANAYTGVRQIDPEVRDAARGMGMSADQLIRRVELPLAVPYLAAGFRTAAVQVIATATLATFVGGGGLGTIISAGFGRTLAQGAGEVLAGGVLVAGLALVVDLLLAGLQRAVAPRGARSGSRAANRTAEAAIGA